MLLLLRRTRQRQRKASKPGEKRSCNSSCCFRLMENSRFKFSCSSARFPHCSVCFGWMSCITSLHMVKNGQKKAFLAVFPYFKRLAPWPVAGGDDNRSNRRFWEILPSVKVDLVNHTTWLLFAQFWHRAHTVRWWNLGISRIAELVLKRKLWEFFWCIHIWSRRSWNQKRAVDSLAVVNFSLKLIRSCYIYY